MKKLLLVLFILTLPLYAATVTFTGGGDGESWNDASNWDVGVPTSADDVVIPSGWTVLLNANSQICKSLTIQSNAALYSGLTSGVRYLTVLGNITNNGIIGNGSSYDGISFAIDGTVAFSGSGIADIAKIRHYYTAPTNTTLTVSTTINFHGVGNSLFNQHAAQTFSVTVAAGGYLNFAGTSTFSCTSPQATTFTFNATSTVEFSGGTLTLPDATAGDATTYGNLTLSGSGTKTLGDNTTIDGILKLAGTTAFALGGKTLDYGVAGSLEYGGTTAQVTSDVEFISDDVVDLIISNVAGVTLNASKSILGDLKINTACTFNDGGRTLTVKDDFTNNGTHAGSGKIVIDPTDGSAAITGASTFGNLDITDNTSLNGTVSLSGNLNHSGGTITNNGTLTFANGVVVTRSAGTFTNSGTINYTGTIDINYTGVVTTGAEASASTSGVHNMNVTAATTLGSDVTVNGTLTLGAALTITGRTLTIKNPLAGTLSNLGDNGSLTVAGTATSILVPAKTYTTLTVNNTNGATLAGDVTATNIICTLGSLTTTAAYGLTWNGGTLNEGAARYIVGTLKSVSANNPGAGAFTNMGLTTPAIAGNNIVLIRTSGPGAAVNFGSNSGIDRQYQLIGTSITFNNVVTVYWTNDDKNGKNMNNVVVWEYDLAGAQWLPRNVTTGIVATPTGSGSYLLASTVASNPAGVTQVIYTVSDNGSPLPVELTSFTASIVDNGVLLNWETATEVDNYGFEIERSVSGSEDWQTLGFIEGAGVSNSTKEYSFRDDNVTVGKYSYRLKQIDLDGAYTYSNAIEVSFEVLPSELTLDQNYPNPFNPATTIKFALPQTTNVSLIVFNVLGEQVAVLQNGVLEAGNYERNFDAGKLTSGIYVYVLKTDNTQISKKMLLVK